MKLLFVQLPVPQQNHATSTGNIPLAAHYLSAALQPLEAVECEIVPQGVADWYGDSALIDYIIEQKPDIIGITLYCWNIERSLYILSQVREKQNVIVIAGGPEVEHDNLLLQDAPLDYLVSGEGEQPLYDLLSSGIVKQQAKPVWLPSAPADAILDRIDLPAMYRGIDLNYGTMLFVETGRGCPYRCSFCHYNQNRSSVYHFREEDLIEIFSDAAQRKCFKIYLLDPTFNAKPQLRSFLRKLKDVHKKKNVEFYAEVNLSNLDSSLIDAFKKAGFAEFEIGVQTLNYQTSCFINRDITLIAELMTSTFELNKRAMEYKIDLIAGLPGETLQRMKYSLNEVDRRTGQWGKVQMFPLYLLPGTELRRKAAELGLQYSTTPPYQVRRTPSLKDGSLYKIFRYAADKHIMHLNPYPELDLSEVQFKHNALPVITRYHVVRVLSDLEINMLVKRLAFTCQLHFYPQEYSVEDMQHMLALFTAGNPYGVYEIVMWESSVEPALLIDSIRIKRPHYLDEDRYFHYPTPGNRAVTFTFASPQQQISYEGEMQRQVVIWEEQSMPSLELMHQLPFPHGIVIFNVPSMEEMLHWYFDIYMMSDVTTAICFADADVQIWWWTMYDRAFPAEVIT